MVKNTGEPGGGPFWVRGKSGDVSPQIVEAAQVDNAPDQKKILATSSHFNPVDIVCGLRDAQGRPFDLAGFTDPQAVLITRRSHEGRALKTLELPGLWNGGMANWNTVFVEVPLFTFNPAKSLSDLISPGHQL